MDTRTAELRGDPQIISKDKVISIFKILSEATKRSRPEIPKKRLEVLLLKAQKIAFIVGITSFSLLLLLAAASVWIKDSWVYWAALCISAVSYLCAVVLLLEPFVLGAPSVYRTMKNPFDGLLERMHEASVNEAKYINELLAFETIILEYAMTQYKAERSAFERRTAILVGTLEKVGIVPAMLAYFAVASTVLKDAGQFVSIIVWTVPAFYCLAFFGGMLNLKMDRVIALLDCSIKLKSTRK